VETRSNYVMVGAVTVALLAGVLLFIVWLAGLSNKATKCYDIYFSQAVGGLNKGSNVTFSGVPVGQVNKISLLPNRPEFVWVRIEVDQQTPVLQGTTAQIKGVGFTGVSEIQLDGAVKGSRPITQLGPQGCPVIPSSSGGLGALLYASHYPKDVQGVVAIAPFLGTRTLVQEIAVSGGLAQWSSTVTPSDEIQTLWRWAHSQRTDRAPMPEIVLAFGETDSFVEGHRLLATSLPQTHVLTAPGGHRWPVWRELWRTFLQRHAPRDAPEARPPV